MTRVQSSMTRVENSMKRAAAPARLPLLLLLALVPTVTLLPAGAGASAASLAPGWSIHSVAQPTNLSAANNTACEEHGGESQVCDSIVLLATNVGSQAVPAGGRVTVADTLPPGVHATSISGEDSATEATLQCTEGRLREKTPLECVDEGEVSVGATLIVRIDVTVEKQLEEAGTTSVINSASVAGGGASAVATNERTAITPTPPPFGIEDFGLQAFGLDGAPSVQAGGRPGTLATDIYFNAEDGPLLGKTTYHPSQEIKDVIVDLPSGFVGDPQATSEKCPLDDLIKDNAETACPPGSRVGTVLFEGFPGRFFASEVPNNETTAVYNMQPEPGFPAEFGFSYIGKPVIMYANAVRIDGSYRLRVTVPGIPELRTCLAIRKKASLSRCVTPTQLPVGCRSRKTRSQSGAIGEPIVSERFTD